MTDKIDDARARQDVELAMHRDGLDGVVALLRRVKDQGRAEVAEEIARAIEVSTGARCPECGGKAASPGRCGGGHTWQKSSWVPPGAAIARDHARPRNAAMPCGCS